MNCTCGTSAFCTCPVHSPGQTDNCPDTSRINVAVPFLREETGLGDFAARLTAALGIPHCGGCQKRREALNRAMTMRPWDV